MDENLHTLMGQTALFAGLGTEELTALTGSMRRVALADGEWLFSQDQPAERFYLVISGQIKLARLAPDGHEKVIELIHAGQPFAEAVAFMEAQRYPVSAQAVGPTEVAGFRNEDLRALLRDSPDACFRLLAAMSRRLHQLVAEIDKLTLRDATYRLVAYLLAEVPEGVLTSPMVRLTTPKQTIASRLSIQPETFSRILARLEHRGLIEVDRNEIVLRDVPALRGLAEE